MFEDALDCFNKELELNFNSSDTIANKGICLLKLNRIEDSLKCLSKVIETN